MKFKAKLEVITPVHIGSGEPPIGRLEYFQKGNRIYIMDMVKLVEEYAKFFNESINKVVNKFINIFSHLDNNRIDDKYYNEIYTEKFKEYLLNNKKYKYSLELGLSARTNNNIEIQRAIKTLGKAYIPGSSIKGAIRTAILMNPYYGKDIEKRRKILKLYENEPDKINDAIIKNFGEYIKDKNWFRKLSISDFTSKEKELLIIENVKGKVGRGNSLRAEFIKPGTIFEGTIKWPLSKKILVMINNNYILQYITFAYQKGDDKIKKQCSEIAKEIKKINNEKDPKTMYLILGAYAGWFSKTVNLIYGLGDDEIHKKFKKIVRFINRNANPDKFPKSFGTVNGNIIGLVKVEFE